MRSRMMLNNKIFGFSKGHSAEDALILMYEYIDSKISEGFFVGALFLDVQGAFEHAPRDEIKRELRALFSPSPSYVVLHNSSSPAIILRLFWAPTHTTRNFGGGFARETFSLHCFRSCGFIESLVIAQEISKYCTSTTEQLLPFPNH